MSCGRYLTELFRVLLSAGNNGRCAASHLNRPAESGIRARFAELEISYSPTTSFMGH